MRLSWLSALFLLSISPAAAQVSALPANQFLASPLTTTGFLSPRTLGVQDFNGGTGASASTFWRGDGTWQTPAGAGTVTSVGQTFTGGLISVAGSPITGAGTLALTVAGTSGGVPYFSAASTWASSGVLTANLPVIGGGAGVAPSVGTRSGNTTQFVTTTGAQTSGDCVKIDASGNHVANGSACGAGGGGNVSNSGTPTADQIGVWVTATTIKGTTDLTVPGNFYTTAGAPTISACGTGAAMTAGSTDAAGSFTVGTTTITSCTITFSAARTSAPKACILSNMNSASAGGFMNAGVYVTTSTTNFVVTAGVAVSSMDGAKLGYFCI